MIGGREEESGFPGPVPNSEFVTVPVLQRTTSCCAAPGKRSGLLFALAAELLELGEHGVNVEIVAGLPAGHWRGRGFRFLLGRRGDGGGQQRRALLLDRDRLFLGGL